MVAMSSTATRTAWRSASAASCAPVCALPVASTCGADNDPDDPTSPGERFGYVYEINYLRCIHCDLCVEACPTEAITETKLFEFAFTNRADAIYTKDELVVDDDGRPQQLPWENWDGGFDPAENTSGWMRATSPGATPEFEGIVAWAGELGYGVRPPRVARRRLDSDRPPLRSMRPMTPMVSMEVATHESRDAHLPPRRSRLPGRCIRRRVAPQPRPQHAEPGRHPVRGRRSLHRPGGLLPGCHPGDRLHGRHRGAVPVRDHVVGRRQGRTARPASRSWGSDRPRCSSASRSSA